MSIGKLFHIIHLTDDLPSLEAWYDRVFSVRRGFLDHHYLAEEIRDASLVVLGDCVIEPLAPSFAVPGWDAAPLGRFYERFGSHWHSIAWYTDDVGEIWRRLHQADVRLYLNGGVVADSEPDPAVAMMTHPRDTYAQLEFMNPAGSILETNDPRLQPGWDPTWWVREHPSGIEGLAHTTVLTKDLPRATRLYVDVLGGTLLSESASRLTGTRDAYVAVGDIVVQLSTPEHDGTLAAQDLKANGEIHHAATFKVVDLDRIEAHLREQDIAVLDRDEQTLITDPATTHAVPFRWTTRDVRSA
ncbi:MAG: hypothetical protein JWO57_1661 [Pseudonocardiales bacterium]|nr:hypothetical protein [Pseudonocardiales bacterium]